MKVEELPFPVAIYNNAMDQENRIYTGGIAQSKG
jgi:hypothetical protein